jgi:hypothetical protein
MGAQFEGGCYYIPGRSLLKSGEMVECEGLKLVLDI